MSAKQEGAAIAQEATKRLRRVTDFLDFCDCVESRLKKGEFTYGDKSFNAPIAVLLDELQQEALDLAGWGFILWTKIERMKESL